MKAGSPGHVPSPIYEAHFSNGARLRLSFWSPGKAPVDFALGRQALEEIYFSDTGNDDGRIWSRAADGGWRSAWPRRHHGITITAAFVEHHTIGRIEDTSENRSFRGPAPAPLRVNWKVRAEAALLELERGNARAALTILQVGKVMAEAA